MRGNILKLKKAMQLYALDNTTPVLVDKAEKSKDYICPECLSPVRVRGGPSRQIHFYHLSLPKQCRQHEKSQEHIQLQLKLLNLIASADVQIECSFPKIRRIADVAWNSKKVVFEIQCSEISLGEAQCRVLDYVSIGYQVVWILHDKQFNQKNLSAAESFLRNIPCYFTNIDKTGYGIVYDQFEVLKDHQRLFKGPPLVVSLDLFSRMPTMTLPDATLPQTVLRRFTNWKCYMQGDLLHRLLKEGNLSNAVKKMLTVESQILEGNAVRPNRLPLKRLIASSYRFVIDYLLKKLTRPSQKGL
jgi:competence protein CoiA